MLHVAHPTNIIPTVFLCGESGLYLAFSQQSVSKVKISNLLKSGRECFRVMRRID
jgi:hypothetical protein